MVPYFSNWLLLYPLAFTLFVGLQISQAAVDGRRLTVSVQLLRSAVFIMFLFAFLAIGFRSSVFSVIGIAILAVISTMLLIKQSRLNRSAVGMTALACRNEQQVRMTVESFYSDHRGLLGRRLRQVRFNLARGVPWVRAFEASGILRGNYEKLAGRLVERFGRLQSTAADLNAPLRVENELERLLSRTSLVIWVILFVPVFMFFRFAIFRVLSRMLAEFEIAMPSSLELLHTSGSLIWITDLACGVMLLFCMGAAMVWLFPSLSTKFPVRWLSEPYFRSLGFVALARAAEQTDDLVVACRHASELVPVNFIAKRFATACDLLNQGRSPDSAFATAKLSRGMLLEQFVSIMDTSGIAWATNKLASTEVERMLNRYSMVMQTFVVGFTLYFAALIGLNAYGMFETLTALIFALKN